jgi:predicted nucleotidyltransferase component of viral defense system
MFHLSTIKEETYTVLKQIFSIPEVYENFALAGGTALALQIGHRDSIDLDIFSPTQFDSRNLEIVLSSEPAIGYEFVNRNSRMLFGFANNVKCDFVHEPAKLIHPFVENDGVKYFHVEDIAAMKMHTICGRGKRKDFFDIYALIELFGWQQMLEWFEKKYSASQFYMLWRSLQYFNDADEDTEINGFPPFTKSWDEIKDYIKQKTT